MRKLLVTGIAAAALVACGDGHVPQPASPTQSCVEPGASAAPIAWDRLRNPIFSLPNEAAKDVAVRLVDGRWRMLFSDVHDEPFRFRIGLTDSADLTAWTTPTRWDQPEVGGLASPDITRDRNGAYIVTYNSHTRDVHGLDKMYYRTSLDFRSWSPPHRLALSVRPAPNDRIIDAAVAHTNNGMILGYNYQEDRFELAWSPSSSIEGPWRRLGVADTGPLENYQFLQIDGVWHMLATTVPVHHELLYRLAGAPDRPESWLHWDLVRELNVPQEAWNHPPGEVANAAFLCDARSLDGHWYLFYAGSAELDRFGGRGYAKIGVARSVDLVHWDIP